MTNLLFLWCTSGCCLYACYSTGVIIQSLFLEVFIIIVILAPKYGLKTGLFSHSEKPFIQPRVAVIFVLVVIIKNFFRRDEAWQKGSHLEVDPAKLFFWKTRLHTHMLTIKRRNGGYNRNITFHKRERKTGRSPATSLWTPETSTRIFHDWHLKVQTLVHTFTLISGCCMCHPTEACSNTQTKPPFSCFPEHKTHHHE